MAGGTTFVIYHLYTYSADRGWFTIYMTATLAICIVSLREVTVVLFEKVGDAHPGVFCKYAQGLET